MPKALKIVVWALVFAAAIAAGAYTASRSDPFPPGVEDPGARPTATPTRSSSSPAATVGDLDMRITSRHVLHVGGSCESDWEVDGTVEIEPSGRVSGQATAKLSEPATCTFPQAQVQTKAIKLLVTGKPVGARLRLGFSESGRTPTGSQDLGGLPNTLSLLHPEVPEDGGTAAVLVGRPDGDLGRYTSSAHVDLSLQ
jgi:hypothetical protein